MKKYLKFILLFVISCVLVFCCSYFLTTSTYDELWNYGFGYNIATGLVPYRDFNMIITPLYAFITSLFITVFGHHLWSMHILNAIMITIMIFLMYKRIRKKVVILFPLLFFICYPGYNLFSLFFMIVLLFLLDEEFKYKDVVLGILVALLFLTKQTIGICCLIPLLFYSKNKIKSLVSFLIPILIFCIYLIFNGAFYNFIDYCFLGMFDFTKENSTGVLFFIEFVILVMLFYLLVRSKFTAKKLFFVIMYQIIAFPILDPNHFSLAVFLVIYYLILNFKLNKLLVILILFFSFSFYIYYVFNFRHWCDKDSFLYGRNIAAHVSLKTVDYVSDYVEEIYKKYDNVYLFLEIAYLPKLNRDVPINKFDLINNGNMGYNGASKYISEMDDVCNVSNDNSCVFILESFVVDNIDEFYELTLSQINLDIYEYVVSNYDKVDGNKSFYIYDNS